MHHKKLKNALFLVFVNFFVLNPLLSAVTIIEKSSKDNITQEEQKILEYTRSQIQEIEENDETPVTYSPLQNFTPIKSEDDSSIIYLYSPNLQTYKDSEALTRWILLRNLDQVESLYVPNLTTVYSFTETKEVIVVYHRMEGFLLHTLADATDPEEPTNFHLLHYMSGIEIRISIYQRMLSIMLLLQNNGLQDCHIGFDSFQFKRNDVIWDGQDKVSYPSSESSYFFIVSYVGFDNIMPLNKKCVTDKANRDVSYLDMGQADDIETDSKHIPLVQNFSLAVLIAQLEAFFWTALYESNNYTSETVKIKIKEIAVDQETNNEISPESSFKEIYHELVPQNFARNKRFSENLPEIAPVAKKSELAFPFFSRQPISYTKVSVLNLFIQAMLRHRNSFDSSRVQKEDIINCYNNYLFKVFRIGVLSYYHSLGESQIKIDNENKKSMKALFEVYDKFIEVLSGFLKIDYEERMSLYQGTLILSGQYKKFCEFREAYQIQILNKRKRMLLV